MDNWQVAQNYFVAAAIAGTVGGYYYYTSKQTKPNRRGSSTGGMTTRRSESDLREKGARRNTRDREGLDRRPKKSKNKPEPAQAREEIVDTTRDAKATKESDISTAAFAQQMLQARQGANLSTSKAKETRVRTVKPRILPASSLAASAAGAEAGTDADDEDVHDTGDVSDMLEARAAGPNSLRIIASEKPQTQRAPRQQKQEVVETKKQRQNRKKTEERKALQEQDERERKTLEEKQRRTAREARGEPAKNGVAKPPTSNPWEQRDASDATAVQSAAPIANTQLLDTFDAESTGSSTGGLDASTAATSTTEGEQAHVDSLSEEDQMAVAMKQSGDESGWTTIALPKKAKQPSNGNMADAAGSSKVEKSSNGQAKLGGFAALAQDE